MALEAGATCHDFFAAHRVFKLGWEQGLRGHADYHGTRLFGRDRYEAAISTLSDSKDLVQNRRDFCLDILYTAGYIDDPGDPRRSLSNLEMTCLMYLQTWEGQSLPVWVQNKDDPKSLVGVEIPFAMKMSFESMEKFAKPLELVYTGKIDGVHVGSSGSLIGVENKTGSRLDDAWRQSFYISHQVTGYLMAMQLMTQQSLRECYVIGAQIPLPKAYENGIAWHHVVREQHQFERWLDWVYHVASLYKSWEHDPLNAPMYSHSCNRYFRPCSFIPLCVADAEEQQAIFEQMVDDEWSPLYEKAGE